MTKIPYIDSRDVNDIIDDRIDNFVSFEKLVIDWSVEPEVVAENYDNNGSIGTIFKYVLNGVTRYRFVPDNYDPTEDAFYYEQDLQTLIIKRG